MQGKAVKSNLQLQGKGIAKPGSSLYSKRILLLTILSFVLYANTLNNGYVLDDFSVIKNNTIVTQGISGIPEILSTPYRWGFFITSNDLYRPLSKVMFAIEYQLFGDNPLPSHFINILLFIGCVILLFLFFDALFEKVKTGVAFLAALLFAIHPIHTEVVANIKSRDELLCFFFAILSMNIYMRYVVTGKLKYFITATLFIFLSLLSKETAIVFVAIVPLIFFFYKNEHKNRSLFITLSYVAAAVTFLLIRFLVLKKYGANHFLDINFIDNQLIHAPSAASRLATAIIVLGIYLKVLFIPYPLISDYSYNSIPFTTFTNTSVLISILIYVALLLVGVYRLLKFKKDGVAFGILFFLIALSIFSNIAFLTGSIMAERFVFLASAGFCWALALMINKWIVSVNVMPLNKKALQVIIPITLLLSVITIARNKDWKDNLTLFTADVKNAPNNARLNYYLANEYILTADLQGNDAENQRQLASNAINYFNKSIEIYPDYNDAHRGIGIAYFFNTQFDSAEYHLKKAIALNPDDLDAWSNLDVVYFNEQKFQQSVSVCKKMLELSPQATVRYNNIGICYLHTQEYDSAVYYLQKGVSADPGFLSFYQNLALAYKLKNNKDSARLYEAIVQKQDPHFSVY